MTMPSLLLFVLDSLSQTASRVEVGPSPAIESGDVDGRFLLPSSFRGDAEPRFHVERSAPSGKSFPDSPH